MDAREELERLEYEIRRSLSTYVIPLGAWADRIAAIREGLGKAQGEATNKPVAWRIWWDNREWLLTDDIDDLYTARTHDMPIAPLYTVAPPTDSAQVLVDALEKIARVNAMDYEYRRWAREALAAHKSEVKG